MDKKLKNTRKTRIIDFINQKDYIPLNIDELAVVLSVPKSEKHEFVSIMDELVSEHRISLTKKGRCIPIKTKLVTGIFSCSRHGYFGFVSTDSDSADIFIHGSNMKPAIDGDTVEAELMHSKRGEHPEGRIIRILDRPERTLIGVIAEKRNKLYKLKCDNNRIYAKVRIEPSNMMGAKLNDRVIAEAVRYEGNYIFCIVKKILGGGDELKALTEGIIYEHHLRCGFPEPVIDALRDIPESVSPEEMIKRLDLRGKTIFTIDGDYSKDFDDAVSIEKTERGFLLGVHIADVSHYVKEGSPLDREAFLRGTSVYLADRTIPMLPEKLSNGICSLNPNADRLTLSVFMNFDNDGNRLDYKIRKSVIRSCERMTYNNTAAILEGKDKELLKRYKNIAADLRLMKRLAAKLEKIREKRGSIDFDVPEVKPVLNEKGEPIAIKKEERLISHKIIESFMLAANEAVAEFAAEKELPFVYRIHENLNAEKLAAVKDFLKKTGIRLVGRVDEDNPLRPKQIQSIIKRTKDTPIERLVSTYMLRSMMKARYSPECSGHFGLAAEYYCHFTSPIRRYPDLTIHRILKEKIDHKIGKKRFAALTAFVGDAAAKSSETEIEAMYCERDVDDLMKTAYMSRFIGSEFTAKISSITSFGIFAETENGAEGLIRLETMKSDYYIFDETLFQLKGERTGKLYSIGDTINVVLVRADINSRQIDFVMQEDASAAVIEKAMKKAAAKKVTTDKLGRPKLQNKTGENHGGKKKKADRKKSNGKKGVRKKRSYYNTKAAKKNRSS